MWRVLYIILRHPYILKLERIFKEMETIGARKAKEHKLDFSFDLLKITFFLYLIEISTYIVMDFISIYKSSI